MHIKLFAQAGIGIAVLLWLLQFTGIGGVLDVILGLNLLYIILASFLFVTASTMVSLALFVALRQSRQKSSLRNVVMASFGGQLLSDVTPARSGYFLTPFILNKINNTPIESGMAGVVATGVINFFTKATISVIALAYFVKFLPLDAAMLNALFLGIFLLVAGSLGLSMLIWRQLPNKLFARFTKVQLIGKVASKFKAFTDIQEEGQKVKGCLLQMSVLIILSTVTNAIALYFISAALGHPIYLLDLILIVPLVTALMYVPITIAGLGIQETGYVVFLTLLGMPFGKAVAFALITRFLFTGTDVLGLPPLLKIGFKLSEKNRNVFTATCTSEKLRKTMEAEAPP